jgi:hypothetical protein
MPDAITPALLKAEVARAMAEELGRYASSTDGMTLPFGLEDDLIAAKVALLAHAAALLAGGSDEVDAQIGRASRVIAELCDGTRRWTMSVPARPDDDPDLILSKALCGARVALATLRSQIAAVTKERHALVPLARYGARVLTNNAGDCYHANDMNLVERDPAFEDEVLYRETPTLTAARVVLESVSRSNNV